MKFVEERFKSKHITVHIFTCVVMDFWCCLRCTLAILAAFSMCARRAGQAAPLAKKLMTRPEPAQCFKGLKDGGW